MDELKVEFSSGLTVLTGETGAGKSILLEALGLVTGKRAEASCVKKGQKRASITAVFDIEKNEIAKQILQENALDDEICILRRILDKDGKSKAFCNDESVTLSFLKKIAPSLLDIHSQHQNQSLLKPESQRKYIDDSSGGSDKVDRLLAIYKNYQFCKSKLDELTENSLDNHKQELLSHLISEFENPAINLAEIHTIEDEHRRLTNNQESYETFFLVSNLLDGADNNATEIIEKSLNYLSKLKSDKGTSIQKDLNVAHEHILNATRALSDQIQFDQNSEAKLSGIEKKLSSLHNLARKHKCRIIELDLVYAKLKEEADDAKDRENLINELNEKILREKEKYFKLARTVREMRLSKSAELSEKISKHLKNLGLPHAELTVEIKEINQEEPLPNGMESIEFRLKTNPAQEPLCLSKVASGGELSRVSLALQATIASQSNVPASIYDEVDSGIGGNTAKIVGKNLKQISKKNQVICITHSAQVACAGHHHFSITKKSDDHNTMVMIDYLNQGEREKEVARMLGNTDQGKVAIEHARQLLREAAISSGSDDSTNVG